MPKVETMSVEEKIDIALQANDLEEAGDLEGADRLLKSIPMPPYLAKIFKKTFGLNYILTGGFNLSEVEAEFGPDWFKQ